MTLREMNLNTLINMETLHHTDRLVVEFEELGVDFTIVKYDGKYTIEDAKPNKVYTQDELWLNIKMLKNLLK